jgi:hypothetical protein
VPPRLRCVNYMVDHICEPICIGWFAFCSSARRRQGGDRRPLTTDRAGLLMSVARDKPEGSGIRSTLRDQPITDMGSWHPVQRGAKFAVHTKIESTVRYLGIEVDDALAIAEQVHV